MPLNAMNRAKDAMWEFLMYGGQKANIPALEGYVHDLIQMTTQKDAGQRGTKGNISWDDLEMVMFGIVCEATALVLSGELERLIEHDDHED